jgi:hypothetical protein
MNAFQKIISIFLLIISLSVAYYFFIFIPNNEKERLEQIKMEAKQNKATETKKVEKKETNIKQKTIIEEKPTQSYEDSHLEIILLNYKIDSNKNTSLVESLLTALNNKPTSVCSSINTNIISRSHIYYIYLDYVNDLEEEYGQYRNSVAYIENDLSGKYKTIGIVKEQCNSVGYQIP